MEALVEYQLPLTSKRADVVLCGVHPHSGAPKFVVVELEQWSRARMVEDAADLCVLEGMGTRLHAVEQVRRYCTHLRDFVAALADVTDSDLAGIAYLHNATDLDLADLWDYDQDAQGRMFTRQRRGEFLTYLRHNLERQAGPHLPTYCLLRTMIAPSLAGLGVGVVEGWLREADAYFGEARERAAASGPRLPPGPRRKSTRVALRFGAAKTCRFGHHHARG